MIVLGACFNPPDAPIDTDASDASDGGTTSTGPGDSTSTADDSTGPGSPCDPNPCENGGECIPEGEGPLCVCPEGFSGDACEIPPADACESNPCENGGECVADGEGFGCECAAGFEGELCEIDIDECADAPCQNGGTCTDQIDGFGCECPSGFEGDACEVNTDDCAPMPCVNGMCIDGVESFECQCGPMFEGDLCECALQGPAQVDYTNQGTFTAGMLYDDPPGIMVTGSNTINVLNLNGLGIVGGSSSNSVDGNEFIEFTFDHPSTSTTYFVSSAGNGDGDGFVGEATIQAFGEAGAPLGNMPVNGTGVFNLNTMFGAGVRITRFRVTANADSFRVSNVSVSPVVCP